MIVGVQFDKEVGGDHKDTRRRLLPVFNGDLGDFVARQFKVADEIELADVLLGGHYHTYREAFYMYRGRAKFTLHDMETGEEEVYVLEPKSRLLIPPRVAHKAIVDKDSILFGLTEDPYVSPKDNDNPFPF